MLLEPRPVGAPPSELPPHLSIACDPARGRVGDEQAAGPDPPGLGHVAGGDVHHSDLGRDDEEAVAAAHEPQGPQAVSVEPGHHAHAVRRHDRGRPVPGLSQGPVVLVERRQPVVRVRAGPCGRDEHGQRVCQRPPAHHEQLDRRVELRRVRPPLLGDREELLEVVAEELRAQLGLPGRQPVPVPAHGVDLAVVRQEVERVREIPRPEGVRREPAVDEGQRALERRIGQILVVAGELRRGQEALVDEPARRQAHDRELRLGHARGRGGPLDAAADHIELALEGRLVAGAPLDEELADDRLARPRDRPEALRPHRRVAPAECPVALLGADADAELLAPLPQDGVAGEEDDPDRVASRLGKVVAELPLSRSTQEPMRQLGHDPRAVPRVRVGAGGSSMAEVGERRERLAHDLVARPPVEPRDRGETARLVLVPWVVERCRHGATLAEFEPYESFEKYE